MIFKILFAVGLGAVSLACAYEICKPGESGAFYRDYSSCKGYIACVDGKSYPGSCPGEFLFNANKSACDFPRNVNCDLKCPVSGNTAFSLPRSCTKYISCSRGKAQYMECLPGTLFDAKTNTCNLLQNVKCPFGGLCPDPRINNTIASTKRCDQYAQCHNGKLYTKYCEPGMHFNAAKQTCDTPENANCPIVTEKEEEMSDIEIVCPESGSFFSPHPMNCHIYYVCHSGKASRMSCGRVLKYDFVSQRCDLPKRAKCIVDALKNNSTIISPYDQSTSKTNTTINDLPAKKPAKNPATRTFDGIYLP